MREDAASAPGAPIKFPGIDLEFAGASSDDHTLRLGAIDTSHLSVTAAEPSTGFASTPLSFFLLGARGRTGLPFLAQALARGHFVTVYVRNLSKMPADMVSHPRLRAFTAELQNAFSDLVSTRKTTTRRMADDHYLKLDVTATLVRVSPTYTAQDP